MNFMNSRRKINFLLLTFVVVLIVFGSMSSRILSSSAHSDMQSSPTSNFVVNLTTDQPDANIADGICDVDLATTGSQCTLRAAVEQANVLASDDVITFLPTITQVNVNDQITINNNGSLQITGNGANATTINGAFGNSRFFLVNATVTISEVLLTGARAGAIATQSGSLTLDRVYVIGNSGTAGGGVYFGAGNNYILNSTFQNNNASANCGGFQSGGSANTTLMIVNSTFSGNFGGTSGGAGCVDNGIVTIRNTTITNNTARIGGGVFLIGGTANFGNSVIAGNNITGTGGVEFHSVMGIKATSVGNNLVGDAPGDAANTGTPIIYQSTDIIDTPPNLSTLNNNGGTTPTHALLANSPAINAGNNANVIGATDQRGFTRIVGGTVDIGAFEVQTVTCDFTINPTNQAIDSSGGNTTVNVTGSTGCSRTAVSKDNWITVTSGGNGSGSGTVTLTVQANTGFARTGAVTIAGQTFTVNQASGCSYSLSPTSVNISANGGNGSFNLNSGAGCPFAATTNSSFITVTSGASGTGNGTIAFSVAANTGTARTGTITVGGLTFTISQASGCTYSLSPTSTSIAATGGNGSFNIAAGTGCQWTAASNDAWITITPPVSGTGNGTIAFSVQANNGVARTGTITVAGQTFTVNQAGGCAYSLSPTNAAFSEAGGNGTINVFAGADCQYTAVSNNSFITITTGANGTGNGSVTFNVAANTGQSRTGTITIAGQVFIITQSDGCSFTISPANINVGASAGSGSFVVNSGEGCARTAVSNASWITISSGSTGSGSGFVTFFWSANTGQARFGTITVAGLTFTINQAAGNANIRTIYDFDGDGKADISVFRPDSGVWYLLNSTSGFTGAQFGIASDKLVPADYDGDGKTDLAVYHNGIWYLQRSSAGFISAAFGDGNDIPQPADFDGDGKADLAVFRPSNGTWYVFNLATNQFTAAQFGALTDNPVVGDYNGDGKADYAVYRPSNGTWYIARPGGTPSQNFDSIQFGETNDKPVPADYDGDGKTDVAVYRPSNGSWYLNRSAAGFTAVQFGISTDLPAPADYDGDGKADIAVFRSGTWYLQRTTAGFTGVGFGTATDKPVPNAYIP